MIQFHRKQKVPLRLWMVNFWDVVQFGQIGQLVNHPLQKLKVNIFITKFMLFSLPFLSLLPLSVWMCKETWWSVDSNKKKLLSETVEYWNGQFNSSPSRLTFSEKKQKEKKKKFLNKKKKSLRRESEQRRKKKNW